MQFSSDLDQSGWIPFASLDGVLGDVHQDTPLALNSCGSRSRRRWPPAVVARQGLSGC